MPLTTQEQAELDELNRQSGVQQTGLSQAEQQELAELNQVVDGGQQQVSQLLGQLGGELPLTREQQAGVFQPTAKTIRQTSGDVGARQAAFNQLERLGFNRDQLENTLQVQRRLDAPRIGRTAGAIGGTLVAGRLVPGPFDDAAIMAALMAAGGAGLGGVAGEAAQTGIQEKRLISQREALNAFSIEAGTEFGGRAVVGAGKLLFSPFIKKVVPEAVALTDDFARVGGAFSPTELDKRFSLRVGEAFSRGSFGAKEIFQEFEEQQGRAVGAFAENIIDSIGQGVARQTPEEIGQTFADGITRPGGRILNIFDDLVNPLYKQIDRLSAGVSVPTKGLKVFAKKQIAVDDRLSELFLSPTGRSKLSKILNLPDNISFSDMRTLRSSFLKDVQKMARDVDQSQGIIKQLAGITDDAIFTPKATKGLSKEGLTLLRNTNALYKAGKEGINKTFSEKLAKRLLKNPSNVVKELFPNNSPKSIRLLRKSLVEPISGQPSKEGKIVWNQLRQSWLADAVDQATKEGVAKPRVFNNILSKMKPEALKEMFPEKETLAGVRRIQDIFDIAGKGPPAGASLFSRGAQATGVVMMYNSGKEGDFVGFTLGSALAIGPLAFAKLATTPKGVKFLTAGFKMKPGASGLVPNAVRMVRLLREINAKEQRQSIAGERKKQQKIQAARTPTKQQLRGFGGRGF